MKDREEDIELEKELSFPRVNRFFLMHLLVVLREISLLPMSCSMATNVSRSFGVSQIIEKNS